MKHMNQVVDRKMCKRTIIALRTNLYITWQILLMAKDSGKLAM